jgi:hypothetical protein
MIFEIGVKKVFLIICCVVMFIVKCKKTYKKSLTFDLKVLYFKYKTLRRFYYEKGNNFIEIRKDKKWIQT